MIIVDPVTLGDVACTRASPKWVFDRTGMLVQVPVDTLAVTYDPSDLSKAPYALIESWVGTNLLTNSEGPVSTLGTSSNVTNASTSIAGFGASIAFSGSPIGQHAYRSFSTSAGVGYTFSVFVQMDDGEPCVIGTDASAGDFSVVVETNLYAAPARVDSVGQGRYRVSVTFGAAGTGSFFGIVKYATQSSRGVRVTGYMLDPERLGSYIPTAGAPVTRAADVITPGAGLVYSNVPITEPAYNAGTTYAKDALAYDPATHNVFQSLIAGNLNKALTDTAAWTPRGATNRWAMLDQYNNTQTTNADEILLVVSPQAISQGLYLGNMFADEARISVVDLTDGLVYSETASLIESTSGSSFFNWAFKRIKRKDYFGTLKLPPYANALITISLRKIGGTAKCGMAAVGPMDEFGPTLMGLSTEGKDYSSTTFNFDGTSSTVIRPYAKKMTCDVMVDNDQIDYVQSRLFDLRQKVLIWFGGPYGSTIVAGRYGSFKNVIQYATRSLMNLTIEGAV